MTIGGVSPWKIGLVASVHICKVLQIIRLMSDMQINSHYELVHRDSTSARLPDSSDNVRKNCTVVCNEEGFTHKCCSKTVPVQLRLICCTRIVHCLCIIGEQSNASFCDPIIPKALGCDSTDGIYKLLIMSGLQSNVPWSETWK